MHDTLGPAGRARRVEDGRRERHHRRKLDLPLPRGTFGDQGVYVIDVVDKHLGLRVANDVVDLVGLQVRVDEHDGSLQLCGCTPYLEEGNGVGQHDRDAVARADASRRQAARDQLSARASKSTYVVVRSFSTNAILSGVACELPWRRPSMHRPPRCQPGT